MEKTKRGDCVDCKLKVTDDRFWLFDFDHVRGEKIANISQMIRYNEFTEADIAAEMATIAIGSSPPEGGVRKNRKTPKSLYFSIYHPTEAVHTAQGEIAVPWRLTFRTQRSHLAEWRRLKRLVRPPDLASGAWKICPGGMSPPRRPRWWWWPHP